MPELKHTKKTHVAYVLDASSSMDHLVDQVVRVIDDQTQFLASLPDAGHEVRVSVYMFSNHFNIKCLVFDTDVLRLPSIKGLYRTDGMTALMDATAVAIDDLKLLPTKYGDHSFLLFVTTDGGENNSAHYADPVRMSKLLLRLGPEWTVAALVPNVNGKLAMQKYGFAAGNVSIWDATSAKGMEDAGRDMQAALGTYMTSRASGVVGTRTLFSTAADAVNAKTIQAAGLQPLKPGTYDLITVPRITQKLVDAGKAVLNKDNHPVWELSAFIRDNGLPFILGRNFYLLRKKELIKGDKELAVLEKATNKVFVGDGVRAMIGLSDKNQSVAADFNKDYAIFVQSKSNNRHLFHGDQVMVLK